MIGIRTEAGPTGQLIYWTRFGDLAAMVAIVFAAASSWNCCGNGGTGWHDQAGSAIREKHACNPAARVARYS